MTKDEIKRELDALGVDYPKDARLADLEALYAPYAEPGTTQDDDTADPNPMPENDPQPEPERSAQATAKTVSCDLLNVRTAPDGDVMTVAKAGTEMTVVGERDGWSKVRIYAWVKSEFLG